MTRKITSLEADFERPLQLLEACHGRIEMQCETLRKLAEHLPVYGCDAQAQQAASNILRYFDSAGRHHHEDEEQDLFPRLAASAKGVDAERVAILVGRLTREHRELENAWTNLRETLETVAHGDCSPLDEREVDRFCGLYRTHIEMERDSLIPLATRLVSTEELAHIGRAMAARRGVIP